MQSQLAKYQIVAPLTEDEIYQKKRKAWLEKEGLHLNQQQINNLASEHRWAIEIIGNLIYK